MLDKLNQSIIKNADKYDFQYNGYSFVEITGIFLKKLEDVIEAFNKLEGNTDERLQYLLGQGLTTEVANKINEMYEDGTLANIINRGVFKDIEEKIRINADDITDNSKDHKTIRDYFNNALMGYRQSTRPITLADIDQQFRQAITGGSVAVVGEGAVGTKNLQNNAVGKAQLKGSEGQIMNKDCIEINIQEGKVKIKKKPIIFEDSVAVEYGDIKEIAIDKTQVLANLYVLYADMSDKKIYFSKLSSIANPFLILAYVNFSTGINNVQFTCNLNSNAIKFIDNTGKEIKSYTSSGMETGFIYPNSAMQINVQIADNNNIKIDSKKGCYILSSNNAFSFLADDSQTIQVANNKYLHKLIFNTSTYKYKVASFTEKVEPSPELLMLGWFMLTDNGGTFYGANSNVIFTNGVSGAKIVPQAIFPYQGGKIDIIGTSITYGLRGSGRLDYPYIERLKIHCGFSQCYNHGISSSTIAENSKDSNWDSVRNPFTKRWMSLNEYADIYGIEGGSNDYLVNVPLGEPDTEDKETMLGALTYVIRQLKKKYYDRTIFGIIPPNMGKEKEAWRTIDDISFYDWTRKIIEVYQRENIPYVDLYTISGINPNNVKDKEIYIPDLLHPNQLAVDKKIAPRLGKFINFSL
jgi:hypothetical protein